MFFILCIANMQSNCKYEVYICTYEGQNCTEGYWASYFLSPVRLSFARMIYNHPRKRVLPLVLWY